MDIQKQILETLERVYPMTPDELARKLGVSRSRVLSSVFSLYQKGEVKTLGVYRGYTLTKNWTGFHL